MHTTREGAAAPRAVEGAMSGPSLEEIRRALPKPAREPVARLVAAAEEGGFDLHLVGGPVRDLLLGRPLRDVDLVVAPREGRRRGAARAVARAAATRGERVVNHDRFGTVELRTAEIQLDVASARAEVYEHAGALPSVREGSLDEDLRRRDFTVNALAVPLNPFARRRSPAVVDPGGGLADLEARTLRVFHERSFHDDPTRALRAARLGPRLGFSLARGTRRSLRGALRDGSFGRVTGERFRAEIEKLFDDVHVGLDPARALRVLDETHVLAALEPGLGLPSESVAALRRLGRWLVEAPDSVPLRRPWLAGLLVWLAPLPAPLRRRTLKRLVVTGSLAKRVTAWPKRGAALEGKLRAVRGRGAFDAILGDEEGEELVALASAAEVGVRRRVARHLREDRALPIPVRGEDLLALGLQGPALGRALAGVRSAVLDGVVTTREEALALAREFARRPAE
jgi:tRNA nucleotidyltransferase (CCA-adding enzyme)